MPLDLATAEDDILEAIDAIRPALQSDGGDIIYQGLDPDGVVHVTLVGACGSCRASPNSSRTSSGQPLVRPTPTACPPTPTRSSNGRSRVTGSRRPSCCRSS